jgi:hypothetical protein
MRRACPKGWTRQIRHEVMIDPPHVISALAPGLFGDGRSGGGTVLLRNCYSGCWSVLSAFSCTDESDPEDSRRYPRLIVSSGSLVVRVPQPPLLKEWFTGSWLVASITRAPFLATNHWLQATVLEPQSLITRDDNFNGLSVALETLESSPCLLTRYAITRGGRAPGAFKSGFNPGRPLVSCFSSRNRHKGLTRL